MQNNLKKEGQFAAKVISEMLSETKKVVESCPVGTLNDPGSIRNQIFAATIEEELPEVLILPDSYKAEVLLNADEKAHSKELESLALRRMFRSVWDTVYAVKSLIEISFENPIELSLRNALVIQRDLLDKIADIPYVHRNNKGCQYVEFNEYVATPQLSITTLPEIPVNIMEDFIIGLWQKLNTWFDSALRPPQSRIVILQSHGQNADAEIAQINAVEEARHKVTKKWETEEMALRANIPSAEEHDGIKGVQSLIESSIYKLAKESIHETRQQLIAIFVEKYYPTWGNWLDMPDEVQKKKLHHKLSRWTTAKHKVRVRDGLVLYVEDGFYNLDIKKEHCERLPYAYHLDSLHVHDAMWDATHLMQEWKVSGYHTYEHLIALRDMCATALYVASAHYYECAGLSDNMETLRRMMIDYRLSFL